MNIRRMLLPALCAAAAILAIPAESTAQSASPAPTSTLRVVVTGLSSNEGHVIIALTKGRKEYEDIDGEPFRGAKAEIRELRATIEFKDIPQGEYAIRLFHDENDNEELDTNFIGIPSEDYGFSNNASGTFGPPSYDDARFSVRQPKQTVSISVE